MDDMLIRSRLYSPVITGTPALDRAQTPAQKPLGESPLPFAQVLSRLQENELALSKHAAARFEEREIGLSEQGLQRLGEGMRIAREKGLDDTLILMGDCAFIVSAKKGTVITGMNNLQGRVITNIEGTVIV